MNLLQNGRALCEFDELSHDVLHNRIINTTILRLLSLSQLDPVVKEELKTIYRRLPQISEIRLSDQVFNAVQLHRNIRFYRFLLDVCRLIHQCLLVDESTGEAKFRDFIQDEEKMSSVFEKFVRNFFRHELSAFKVGQDRIRWQRTIASEANLKLLPMMMTDISLSSGPRKIIIDTKFYREALNKHFGKLTVRSGHLYQLLAYLTNLAPFGSDKERPEGILLYPAIANHFDLAYEMHGFDVRVHTIDLNKPWRKIHESLLSLITRHTND